MTCDNDVARQFVEMVIQQVTPFYIMATVAIVSLGIVAIGIYRGKVVAPPIVRGIVSFALIGALVFTLYRVGYDRAFVREWTTKMCSSRTAE